MTVIMGDKEYTYEEDRETTADVFMTEDFDYVDPVTLQDTLEEVEHKLEIANVGFDVNGFVKMANCSIAQHNSKVIVPFDNIVSQMPTHPTEEPEIRKLSDITRIIIHHSVTPDETPPINIARYHVNRRDWPTIGYHFCIRYDGEAWQTAPLTYSTHHAAKWNDSSIGICLIGSFVNGKEPPKAQIDALQDIIDYLMGEITTINEWFGHKDLMSTRCPGDTWDKWKEQLY